MKLSIRSLFWKIFLCFWATVVLIVMSIVMVFLLDSQGGISRWHESMIQSARNAAMPVIAEIQIHGTQAASAFIKNLDGRMHTYACLTGDDGDVIADDGCSLFTGQISLVRSTGTAHVVFRNRIARVALPIQGADGRKYIYAVAIVTGAPAIDKKAVAIRLCVALIVSFFICYWLTKYLTDPVLRLREASHRLAAGELNTRAARALERRNDELGFLVRDFNAMAERIEELISRQKQLIYDISHELRSPLARLNVALDLARERKGDDSAFDQAEQDLERMGEMIGRMLTIAKLDTSSAEVKMVRVNLGELVSQVVHSAEFEFHERENAVAFAMHESLFVSGNPDLLQSAVENVIRNAIRYSPPDKPVLVELEYAEKPAASMIHLSIRDFGAGVPETELSNIFRPFYRIESDRDRQSGGAGLGLAIAGRVVRMHGGTIHARNIAPEGLCVDIFLPAAM